MEEMISQQKHNSHLLIGPPVLFVFLGLALKYHPNILHISHITRERLQLSSRCTPNRGHQDSQCLAIGNPIIGSRTHSTQTAKTQCSAKGFSFSLCQLFLSLLVTISWTC